MADEKSQDMSQPFAEQLAERIASIDAEIAVLQATLRAREAARSELKQNLVKHKVMSKHIDRRNFVLVVERLAEFSVPFMYMLMKAFCIQKVLALLLSEMGFRDGSTLSQDVGIYAAIGLQDVMQNPLWTHMRVSVIQRWLLLSIFCFGASSYRVIDDFLESISSSFPMYSFHFSLVAFAVHIIFFVLLHHRRIVLPTSLTPLSWAQSSLPVVFARAFLLHHLQLCFHSVVLYLLGLPAIGGVRHPQLPMLTQFSVSSAYELILALPLVTGPLRRPRRSTGMSVFSLRRIIPSLPLVLLQLAMMSMLPVWAWFVTAGRWLRVEKQRLLAEQLVQAATQQSGG